MNSATIVSDFQLKKLFKSDPEYVDFNGNNWVILACMLPEISFLDELLDRKYDINHQNKLGETALYISCKNRQEQHALRLLTCQECDVNITPTNEHSALFWACFNKMDTIALLIIDRIVDVNYNIGGHTALMVACYKQMEMVAMKILEHKNCRVDDIHKNNTALTLACYNKMENVAVKILESKNCRINQIDQLSYTALMYGCYYKLDSVINKILERDDCDAHIVSQKGYSALEFAKKSYPYFLIPEPIIRKIKNKPVWIPNN